MPITYMHIHKCARTHTHTHTHTHTPYHTWCSFTKVMCVRVGMALVMVVVRHLESLVCPVARNSHTPGPGEKPRVTS